MNLESIAMITLVLAFAGLVVSYIQAHKFFAKMRQTLTIEKSSVHQTMRWILLTGLWCGFFAALTAAFVIHADPNTQLSAWGMLAMFLEIPIACTALLVMSFLLGVYQFRIFNLPAIKRKQEKIDSSSK